MLSRIKKFIFKPDCVKQGKTNIIIFKNENGEKKIEVIIKKSNDSSQTNGISVVFCHLI